MTCRRPHPEQPGLYCERVVGHIGPHAAKFTYEDDGTLTPKHVWEN